MEQFQEIIEQPYIDQVINSNLRLTSFNVDGQSYSNQQVQHTNFNAHPTLFSIKRLPHLNLVTKRISKTIAPKYEKPFNLCKSPSTKKTYEAQQIINELDKLMYLKDEFTHKDVLVDTGSQVTIM